MNHACTQVVLFVYLLAVRPYRSRLDNLMETTCQLLEVRDGVGMKEECGRRMRMRTYYVYNISYLYGVHGSAVVRRCTCIVQYFR
jgi:hypothetical protein